MTRQVRAVATVTFVVTGAAAVAMFLGFQYLGLALAVLQASVFVRAVRTPDRHPYRLLARPIAVLFPLGEAEHPLPLRFAAQIGCGFIGAALVATPFSSVAAVVFLASCSLAAALNAFANLCLACLLYPRVQLIGSSMVRRQP